MYGKKLAYGVKIKEIREIPGADRIELATVMDYTVVVKKGEYKPGDMGIYVEVDSLLPDGLDSELSIKYNLLKNYEIGKNLTDEERENAMKEIQAQSKYPYFEFLRDKKFKIKSMKLSKFGVISQGILFRPVDLGITDKVKEGQDFTIQFNITEIVQDEEEAGLNTSKKDNFITRYLMRYKWFRNWRKRHNIAEVWDPTFPGKSDEENVQKIYTKMFAQYADKEWVATEKLEGQNITVYSEIVDGWFGRKTKRIGVCSRTRELNPNGNSHGFWDTVKRLHLDEKIKNIPGEWFCRGEHVGPGIQGNIYQLKRTEVYFFDFYKKVEGKWVKLNFDESIAFAKQWDLPFVPVLDEHYKLPEGHTNEQGVFVSGADIMLQQSDKNTVFGNNLKHKREGFVLRLKDDYNVSFKVKNPNYSI
jgi:hypothetical protein